MRKLALIENGEVKNYLTEGRGKVYFKNGSVQSPATVNLDAGDEKVVPVTEIIDDQSTKDITKTVEDIVVGEDEVTITRTVVDVPIEEVRSRASLDRFNFALNAAKEGFVTWEEAALWAAGNAIPTKVRQVLDSLPEEDKGPATVEVLAIPTIRRNGNLMPALIVAFNTDEFGLDRVFGIT